MDSNIVGFLSSSKKHQTWKSKLFWKTAYFCEYGVRKKSFFINANFFSHFSQRAFPKFLRENSDQKKTFFRNYLKQKQNEKLP